MKEEQMSGEQVPKRMQWSRMQEKQMREMRDSGVEWIGEIPKDWNCCKQKYRFTLINGRAFKDNEFEEDGTYRILRVGNLFSNPVWYSSSLELEPDKYCEKGDLIYAWSMSYGPYIWNEEKVIYHYHIWKTKLVSDMDKMFSYYYLQALTESIKSQTHETTMGFVTMGIMNNSYIAYPRNIKEQKKISDYLDAKCSKIDEIIEKQLSIIEKLKEYKLSIITEAVTSGINPDVEMKDTLASFNRVYAYITQVCRLFDKDIHRFSIYSKFLYTMLPNGCCKSMGWMGKMEL